MKQERGKKEDRNIEEVSNGCPFECSRKMTEQAGFKVTKSILLARDIGMKKKALHEDIGQNMKPLMDYVSQDDVKKAKELIVKAILEG
jgi:uncharacterized metal-binding protein